MAGEINYKFMFPQKGEENVLTKPNFIFEPKIDGVRVFVQKHNNSVRLVNRKGENIIDKYPELKSIYKNILTDSCILDAELTVLNKKGFPDIELLQQREQGEKPVKSEIETPAVLFVFDILDIDGIEMTDVPLDRRKVRLKEIVRENFNFKLLLFSQSGTDLWKRIKDLGIKGVIAKDIRSRYNPEHSFFWLKIEPNDYTYADSMIAGCIKRKETNTFSLILANYRNEHIVYTGTSKLPVSMAKTFEKLTKKLKMKESIFPSEEEMRAVEGSKLVYSAAQQPEKQKQKQNIQKTLKPEEKKTKRTRKVKPKVQWLKPDLVAEIQKPSMKFMRLRFDKKYQSCILEY